MESQPSVRDGTLGRLVVRNTLYLTASQALTVPIAVLVNAMLARSLGPSDFGMIYLASTLASFGFLVVNWGHEGALPALVARDRAQAGALLGSSLAWRAVLSFVVYALFALACHLLRYGWLFQWALLLTFVISGFTSFIAASKDTIRGFERTDIPAITHVGQQIFTALLIVPVLIAGGRMRATLAVQIPVCIIVFVLIARTLKPVGVGALAVKRDALKELFVRGTPFVFFNLAMALQPNIDAVFLSKLAPAEVMGWFAVSRRLTGVLLFPATALIGALYPTLCRLHTDEPEGYASVARGAIQGVALLAVPVAAGCGLYPELGVAIFSRKAFGAAEDNLRILSVFLFLVYFSMPLGTCILAAGKQRAWSIVQCLCVVVSLILDPLLVPWFQTHYANGGLGLCTAAVASETLVVVCGIALMPRGVFDRPLVRSILLAILSGAGMAIVAWLAKPITPWLAAPLALLAYAAVLYLTGGVSRAQIMAAKTSILRKFSRGS
jgi:O-antigen/teichoic acid export membrane protein